MKQTTIPNRILTESAMRHNIAGSMENMHAFAYEMLLFVLGPQGIQAVESAESIALAREKMGLREKGGGDL